MKFLYNAPAIFHKDALIIGDAHFGIEGKLFRKGIFSNDFSEKLAEKIIELLKQTKAKKIIFLGDVKDDITYLDQYTIRAFRKIKEYTDDAKNKIEIIIVRGNHDGGIENLGNGITIVPSDGFVYHGLGLIHGHSWPSEQCMKAKYLISAHQHPQIEFIDSSEKRHVETVWIVASPDEKIIGEHYENFNKKITLIMMPAFNPIIGNTIKTGEEKHLGPILNNKLFKWNDALLYRLNGIPVRRLSSIKVARWEINEEEGKD
ncbi:MAG: metallophosphoesterase [Candidatus Micrarchaeia archaeon]